MDRTLLEFVHDKLDLYKKLRAPEVNETLKFEWYEDYKQRLENLYENSPNSLIDSLLRNPLKIADFQPLTRDQVHERG
jgi:hypothetical protein